MTDADGLKIAFDHRIFVVQQFGGISRYFVEMAAGLAAQSIAPRIIAPLHINAYLDDAPSWLRAGKRLPSTTTQQRIAKAADATLARPLAAAYGAPIVHETYYSEQRLAPRKAKVALTVYDMIHELQPAEFGQNDKTRNRKAAAIERADHIFCISESTKRDLISFYPDAASRSSVTLLGFSRIALNPDAVAPERSARPYILFVGKRGSYKNFASLLDAFAGSASLRSVFDIRCVGGGGLRPDERIHIARLGLNGQVHHEAVNDVQLHKSYRHAALFVYPSLYEGFGIPPLEAMAGGCPVVTMNVSSMPEVCGDAVEYAEPDDLHSLTKAMERVALSADRADALRLAGHSRIAHFSWAKCAAETAAVYRGML
jgi:glycosyltransferase involved in cell wall biosynthesis